MLENIISTENDRLALAYKKISAFIHSYDWKIKQVVFDGEIAMGTDEFLLTVRETGARPIPLPESRKAQRAERKQE